MTSAEQLLTTLKNAGVKVELGAENKLRIDAPRGAISADLRTSLQNSKSELIELLKQKNKFTFRHEKDELNKKSTIQTYRLSGNTVQKVRADRTYAFQTPWMGTCFVCEKPVANYYENCSHCGDFPAWF